MSAKKYTHVPDISPGDKIIHDGEWREAHTVDWHFPGMHPANAPEGLDAAMWLREIHTDAGSSWHTFDSLPVVDRNEETV